LLEYQAKEGQVTISQKIELGISGFAAFADSKLLSQAIENL